MRDMMFGLGLLNRSDTINRMRTDTPIIFMSGDADPVGGYGMQVAKIYRDYVRAGFTDVAYKFYKGARHEILNEINRDEVYRDILDWIFTKLD